MSHIFMVFQNLNKKIEWKILKIWSYSQELQILLSNATAQLLSVSQMWRFLFHLKFFEELA